MRQFSANHFEELKVQLIFVSLLALFLTVSTNLAQFYEELDSENGFLHSHFGDALSEFGLVKTHFKSKDNRVVVVTKNNAQASWKGCKLKDVGYVFLDEVLVRIVAFMDPSTNYDSLVNLLNTVYGGRSESFATQPGLLRADWNSERVELECYRHQDGVWMDIQSKPLRAEYRRWRRKNSDESERWPLPNW
jgi:hypothetical protein